MHVHGACFIHFSASLVVVYNALRNLEDVKEWLTVPGFDRPQFCTANSE